MSWFKKVGNPVGIKHDAKRLANAMVHNATWKQEESGRQNFNMPIVTVSTRYFGHEKTAWPSLLLQFSQYGDHIILARGEISAKDELTMKIKTEKWIEDNLARVVKAMLTEFQVEKKEYEEKFQYVVNMNITSQ